MASLKDRQQAEYARLMKTKVKNWPSALRIRWSERVLEAGDPRSESAAIVWEWVEREVK